jgi:hypothetical protein
MTASGRAFPLLLRTVPNGFRADYIIAPYVRQTEHTDAANQATHHDATHWLSQVPFSLPFDRLGMLGSKVLNVLSVFRFFARRAKKRKTKGRKSTAANNNSCATT